MAEVASEARYVQHNRHKIVLIFAAMRHFCDELRSLGFTVHYFAYSTEGPATLLEAVKTALESCEVAELRCGEPGEYRLLSEMQQWALPIPVRLIEDDRFLCTPAAFAAWAEGRKQLRMEYFYRIMRRQYQVLLDDGGRHRRVAAGTTTPRNSAAAGAVTRAGATRRPAVTAVDVIRPREVIELVQPRVPGLPGRSRRRFYLGVTAEQAAMVHISQWFVDTWPAPRFGHLPGCPGGGVTLAVSQPGVHVPEYRPAGTPAGVPPRGAGLARRPL